MMKKHITRTLIASAVLFSFNSTAATSYFEARNDAMGGTGGLPPLTMVWPPLANPALLTKIRCKKMTSVFCFRPWVRSCPIRVISPTTPTKSAMTGKPSTVPSTATPGYRRQRPA